MMLLSIKNYFYDTLGKQTRVDYHNGTYTEYTYHPTRNWLTAVVNKNSGGTVISSFDYYTYDNVGNRLQMTENSGQMTETAYIYNANNQLFTETVNSDTTTLYSYDNNGNLISKTDGLNTTDYEWDWRNMLVQVSSSQSPVTSYEYDGDGNRISKTTDGVKTKYINDVALPLVQVLMETDESDTVLATYTYGNDLISMNRAKVNSYYHYDGLGSTRQLTSSAGSVTVSYTYDGFGNLIASTGTTPNAYGFTGESQFSEADNLVFLRARYYDPSIGRFISRDPILSPMVDDYGSYWVLPDIVKYHFLLYHYVYVANNSINYIDPSGKLLIPKRKAGDQDYICSGPAAPLNKNECYKNCCKDHDICYERHGCSAWSWIPPNPIFFNFMCSICNAKVVGCLAGAAMNPCCH